MIPRPVRLLLWVPFVILAVGAYLIGGALFVVLPLVVFVSVRYWVRRRALQDRAFLKDYNARPRTRRDYMAERRSREGDLKR